MNPLNDPITLTEQVRQLELENSQYQDVCQRNYTQTTMIQEREQAILELETRISSLVKANDTHVGIRRRQKQHITSLEGGKKVQNLQMDDMRTAILSLKGENDVLGAQNAVLERRCKRFADVIRNKMRVITDLRHNLRARINVIAGIKSHLGAYDRVMKRYAHDKQHRRG